MEQNQSAIFEVIHHRACNDFFFFSRLGTVDGDYKKFFRDDLHAAAGRPSYLIFRPLQNVKSFAFRPFLVRLHVFNLFVVRRLVSQSIKNQLRVAVQPMENLLCSIAKIKSRDGANAVNYVFISYHIDREHFAF